MTGRPPTRSRTACSVAAALLVAGGVLVSALLPAAAQAAPAARPGDTVVVPVVGGVTPALPDGVVVRAARGGAGLVVVNPTAVPLTVAGPDGRDFLRISAAGVETDAAAPFTHLSRPGSGTAVALPDGVDAAAPPRWHRVSTDISWDWTDPRVRPAAGLPPVGGHSHASHVLARWRVPLRYGTVPAVLDGTLEAQAAPEPQRVTVDPPPAGITAVAGPGGLTLAAPAELPVAIRGVDGEEFLRHTVDGWEVATGSPTHRLDLLAAGRPVPPDTGWQPVSGGHTVTWSDPRLDPAPGAAVRWRIPVEVADGAAELTGGASRAPAVGQHAAPGGLGGAALLPAVGFLGVLLALLLRRDRRLAAADPPSPMAPAPALAGRAS